MKILKEVIWAVVFVAVGFGFGMTVEVRRVRDFEYVRNEKGEIESIKMRKERWSAGTKLFQDYATFNESTGLHKVIPAHPTK